MAGWVSCSPFCATCDTALSSEEVRGRMLSAKTTSIHTELYLKVKGCNNASSGLFVLLIVLVGRKHVFGVSFIIFHTSALLSIAPSCPQNSFTLGRLIHPLNLFISVDCQQGLYFTVIPLVRFLFPDNCVILPCYHHASAARFYWFLFCWFLIGSDCITSGLELQPITI